MSCEQLDLKFRCPFDPNAPTAWNPGDLNRFFENLVHDSVYKDKNLQVHWSPDKPFRNEPGPWIVTIDDFLSPEECERMIQLGHNQGYVRSTTVGPVRHLDGTIDVNVLSHRTSSTAWCNQTECLDDPLAKGVVKRIENLTGIPYVNSEYLQLLKYEVSVLPHLELK